MALEAKICLFANDATFWQIHVTATERLILHLFG